MMIGSSNAKPNFYITLAKTNLTKNRSIYFPFALLNIFLVAMFLMIRTIALDPGMGKMSGGGTLAMLMAFGTGVMAVFSGILVFYTNGFLMKRRKKEIGLYNILGFSKRHIAKMMLTEIAMIAAICTLAGGIVGTIFMKLLYLLLLKLTSYPITLNLPLSYQAILETLVVFSVYFLAITLYNLAHITLSKPIELLRGGQVGEKPPRTRWLLGITGAMALGWGYYFSLTVTSPLQAITMFFVAVLAVIYGTFALFVTGSIVFLKILKRNNRIYYKTRYFTVISGMLYRMKQHAAGLATLCILSTMVMISISTTVSLYAGLEDSLNAQYPREISINTFSVDKEAITNLEDSIALEAKASSIALEDGRVYRSDTIFLLWDETSGAYTTRNDFMDLSATQLTLMDQKSYQAAFESEDVLFTSTAQLPILLVFNEVQYANLKGRLSSNDLVIDKASFPVGDVRMIKGNASELLESVLMIYPSIDGIEKMYKTLGMEDDKNHLVSLQYNVIGTDRQKLEFAMQLKNASFKKDNEIDYYVSSKSLSRRDFTDFYGGMLFLGIFLGALFLSATIIIMYYKQITEGYEDQARYETMQKVGMHHQEIKQAINTQTILVFFLPLLVASSHVAFSFNVVRRMLALFNFNNIGLFIICSGLTAFLFAAFYWFFYRLTTRAYFRIVRWDV